MKHLYLFLAIVVFCFNSCSSPIDYVDPHIGSSGHGHVFVGASIPRGMLQVGPQNIFKGWDWCSGYHYSDSILIGFSHTHLSGTGCKDFGDIILMPFYGEICKDTTDGYIGNIGLYSHEDEIVSPYYYSVKLQNGILAEMTSSCRTALHRYTFPNHQRGRLLLNLFDGNGFNASISQLRVLDQHTITGFRKVKGWASQPRTVYFAMKTDIPIDDIILLDNNCIQDDSDFIETSDAKAIITFAPAYTKANIKVSISSVSTNNAMENLEKEIPHWNFRKVYKNAKKIWNKELSKVLVRTDDKTALKIFYTALYHTMIAPSVYCDVNGEFMGIDGKIHKTSPESINYSTFSCWDTYRALHPWLTIIDRRNTTHMVNSMLSIYDQQGKLPIWPLFGGETNTMPGYGSIAIVSDAVMKNIPGIDAEHALNCAIGTATNINMPGIQSLEEFGYIPADKETKATSAALEYAISDWGIASMAKKCNKFSLYEKYNHRAYSWKNYFDVNIGLIRPKLSNGTWASPYNPIESIHGKKGWFTEGTGWQYSFSVPQDPYGLIEIMGGDNNFCQKLDSLFTVSGDIGENASMDITGLIGQYAHGNEPSHHVAYLYVYAGKPWKTAEIVDYIQNKFYTDYPDGIIGNEDCGQMSAWYILSSLGFYQVNPSCGEYSFGRPLFDKVVLKLDNGKKFTINTKNNTKVNKYIQSIKLNGQPYNMSYIQYKDIIKGGTLEFSMGSKPNYEFGLDPKYRPKNKI